VLEAVELESLDADESLVEDELLDWDEDVRPLADDVDDDDPRESVMYQPLPLNTMPTG
jgi:hypothetical protein